MESSTVVNNPRNDINRVWALQALGGCVFLVINVPHVIVRSFRVSLEDMDSTCIQRLHAIHAIKSTLCYKCESPFADSETKYHAQIPQSVLYGCNILIRLSSVDGVLTSYGPDYVAASECNVGVPLV